MAVPTRECVTIGSRPLDAEERAFLVECDGREHGCPCTEPPTWAITAEGSPIYAACRRHLHGLIERTQRGIGCLTKQEFLEAK